MHETLSFLSLSTWLFHPFSFFWFYSSPSLRCHILFPPTSGSFRFSLRSIFSVRRSSEAILWFLEDLYLNSITLHFIEAIDGIPVVKTRNKVTLELPKCHIFLCILRFINRILSHSYITHHINYDDNIHKREALKWDGMTNEH